MTRVNFVEAGKGLRGLGGLVNSAFSRMAGVEVL
jgi:hypothetical protein